MMRRRDCTVLENLVPLFAWAERAVHPLADAADEAGGLQLAALVHSALSLGGEQSGLHLADRLGGGGAPLAALLLRLPLLLRLLLCLLYTSPSPRDS